MKTTLDYYNENAASFVSGTVGVEFTVMQDKFLDLLPTGGYILDFGCGSGRDTRYFLKKGYQVDATDGSEELCRIASEYANTQVRKMLFQELDEHEKYDGIWACSSILHVPKAELADVLRRMYEAVKPHGVIYTSFKYSTFEGVRNGRYFSDFTEEDFVEFLKQIPQLQIEEYWITGDCRPGRGDERWLNLIIRRSDMR